MAVRAKNQSNRSGLATRFRRVWVISSFSASGVTRVGAASTGRGERVSESWPRSPRRRVTSDSGILKRPSVPKRVALILPSSRYL